MAKRGSCIERLSLDSDPGRGSCGLSGRAGPRRQPRGHRVVCEVHRGTGQADFVYGLMSDTHLLHAKSNCLPTADVLQLSLRNPNVEPGPDKLRSARSGTSE